MAAYLTGLDARSSSGTFISVLKILVDTDDDRLFVVCNGGIQMAFEALHSLHSTYHEASASHVAADLQDLLTELVLLVSVLRNRDLTKKLSQPSQSQQSQSQLSPPQQSQTSRPQSNCTLKGLSDAVRRLATLLNTFNCSELRNISLDVLKELVKNCYLEVTNILVPLLTHCHVSAQNTTHSIVPLGPYFPRRGSKSNWTTLSKNIPRPTRPMLQMSVPQAQILQKGIDRDYDSALESFYKPYHDFLDVMFRMSVNLNQLNESLINLSCLAGFEAASLHFNLFPKFWVGVHNNKSTNK